MKPMKVIGFALPEVVFSMSYLIVAVAGVVFREDASSVRLIARSIYASLPAAGVAFMILALYVPFKRFWIFWLTFNLLIFLAFSTLFGIRRGILDPVVYQAAFESYVVLPMWSFLLCLMLSAIRYFKLERRNSER